jgi:hypothetical protein
MHSVKTILENPTAGKRDLQAGQELSQALTTVQTPHDSIEPQILPSSDVCPVCEGRGLVERSGNRYEQCVCILRKIIHQALPARYRCAQLEDFSEKLQGFVIDWLKNPTDGLFVHGTAGSGKTHLAAAIFIDLVQHRQRVRFRRAAQLFQSIRDSYGQEDVSEEEVLRDYIEPKFLVLDDLGTGSLSDHERRYSLEVIDRRGNDQKPTIITTNWTLKQIVERLDERVASRLSGYTLMNFEGKDRRSK